LIDELELQIARLTVELKRQGADHRYIPLLLTAPGFGWINAYTVASQIGDIERFPSPAKRCGYTGLCPRVLQSGTTDRRGPIHKARAALPALGAVRGRHERLQAPALHRRTKRRLGRQRGPQGRPKRPQHASSPRRSGTCFLATNPSLRQPVFV
jgi:transposase